ncbi:MAG: FHA domain-containing protein [Myxococcales bacterium]|nr:FHA domain-containing protein [Myxococcales bacterium]HRC57127.1 FHA domain-containing protein [Kofleriaceae bacterium]
MSDGPTGERHPGLLVVWSGAAPTLQAFPIGAQGLVLGRELLGTTSDDRISRQHARVAIRDSAGTDPGVIRFGVTDLASRNGTFVSGQLLVERDISVTAPAVVRAGRTVAIVLDDLRRFREASVVMRGDTVVGPSTSQVWQAVESAAAASTHLLITGEDGVGKSRLGEHYAQQRKVREARFDPTVHAVALERVVGDAMTLILEAPGKLTAAHHEALGRLLDQREALRVVTTATQRLEALGMPAALAARLSARVVEVPPLRSRPEELSYLVAEAVKSAAPALSIHSSLIEVSLLRPWPGNVRELSAAVVRAAHEVAAAGKNNLRGEDLDTEAGYLMAGAPTINASVQPTMLGARRRRRSVSKADEN